VWDLAVAWALACETGLELELLSLVRAAVPVADVAEDDPDDDDHHAGDDDGVMSMKEKEWEKELKEAAVLGGQRVLEVP
jgi:hypothetical protein